MENEDALVLAAQVTSAWLSNPHTHAAADDAAALFGIVRATLGQLAGPAPTATPTPALAAPEHVPAVSVRASLRSPDHILSMIDGRPYRSLTRHLRTHGLSPDAYRKRYGLAPDYPMVAPSSRAVHSAAAGKRWANARAAQAAGRGEAVKPQREGRAAAVATPPLAEEPAPATVRTRQPRTRKSVAEARAAAQAHLGQTGDDNS